MKLRESTGVDRNTTTCLQEKGLISEYTRKVQPMQQTSSLAAGLLQSLPLLGHQSSEGFIKVISEFPSGMSDIGFSLSSEQSKDGVVERG